MENKRSKIKSVLIDHQYFGNRFIDIHVNDM